MDNLLGSTIFYFFIELVSLLSFILQIVLSPFTWVCMYSKCFLFSVSLLEAKKIYEVQICASARCGQCNLAYLMGSWKTSDNSI